MDDGLGEVISTCSRAALCFCLAKGNRGQKPADKKGLTLGLNLANYRGIEQERGERSPDGKDSYAGDSFPDVDRLACY
jgi:hypothetical protein